MRLLIDACNVLHVTGVLPPELAVGEPFELAQLILRSRYARNEVTLVCDGSRPGQQELNHDGLIHLRWTGNISADSVIDDVLQQSSHARQHLVISSDRAVQTAASHRGAQTLASDRFLAQLANDARRGIRAPTPNRNIQLDAESTRRWMKELGLPEEPE